MCDGLPLGVWRTSRCTPSSSLRPGVAARSAAVGCIPRSTRFASGRAIGTPHFQRPLLVLVLRLSTTLLVSHSCETPPRSKRFWISRTLTKEGATPRLPRAPPPLCLGDYSPRVQPIICLPLSLPQRRIAGQSCCPL